MRLHFPFGLRARLVLLVAVAVTPALIALAFNANTSRRLALEKASAAALQTVGLVADTEDQYVEQARQILVRLSALPSIERGIAGGCREVFNDLQTQYLQQYPRYANLGTIHTSGEIYCSVLPVSGAVNIGGHPYFQRALQSLDLTLGEYAIDPDIGRSTLSLFYPVVDFGGGQAVVVVFATLDLSGLSALVQQSGLPDSATFTVVDANGRVLVGDTASEPALGQSLPEGPVLAAIRAGAGAGTTIAPDAAGVRRLFAYAPLGAATAAGAAYAIVGVPADEILAQANQEMVSNLLALAAAVLLALAGAWFGGDLFVLRQVHALVRATQRLSAGDLSARTGLPPARAELNQLAHAFDQMAARLEERERQRQQAEAAVREREAQYRAIFESTSDGLIITDPDTGGIVQANLAACAMHGYTPEAFARLHPTVYIHPDYHHEFDEYQRALRAGERFEAQVIHLRQDGTPFHVSVHGVGVAYGGRLHFLAVLRDITEQVESQQLLEGRVRERTHELSALLQFQRRVAATLELDPLLDLILEQVQAVVACTGITVMTHAEDTATIRGYRGPAPAEHVLGYQYSIRGTFAEPVIARGEPYIVPDLLADTAVTRAISDEQRERRDRYYGYVRSWMGVPLLANEACIGLLALHHTEPDYFDSRHAELALAFASQAAVALQNARLFQAEQRRAEQFRVISEVGNRITSILDVHELLNQTVRLIREVFGYHHVHIGLLEGDVLRYPAAAGVWQDEAECRWCEPMRLRVGQDGVSGRVAATGRAVLVPDIRQEPAYVTLHPGPLGSELVLPLQVKGQIIGVLDVESERLNAFDESDMAVLQSLTNQVAVAIENARLYEQASQLAALQERQKLARELHDSVSQALYSIALGARTARTQLDRDPAKVAEPLDYVLSLAQAALAEMRALIFELRPESLEQNGLVVVLNHQAESLRVRHRLEVNTQLGEEPAGPLEVKQAMYRIAQEALHNVVKHARATHVDLTLASVEGRLRLEVRDNGAGFDAGGDFPGHLGLRSMRERAAQHGGTLTVHSTPGAGTWLVAEVPVKRAG